MNKRKMALFVNGYCTEIVTQFFDGFWKGLENQNVDVYCFCAYPASNLSKEENYAELNIYNLPELRDFDVAIIMANGIDYLDIYDILTQKCIDAGIPFITTDQKVKGGFCVSSNNIIGTNELINHVIKVLGCKDIAFLAGSARNPDSALRLKIVRDTMAENGLTLSDDETRVYYTGWKLQSAMDYADLIYSKQSIPEIIICANDDLSMALCNRFESLGIKVPEDVMVTGFDNGYYAKIFNPAISTVDQSFDEVGRACANLALEIIGGDAKEKEIVVQSRFIARESTGNLADKEVEILRKDIGKSEFGRRIIDLALTRRIDALDRIILSADSLEQVHDNIKKAHIALENYDRHGLHIMLDNRYVESVNSGCDDFRCFEYSDEFYVLYSREGEVEHDIFSMPKRQLIPHIDEMEENRFFLFSPLRERGKTFGYVIQCDRLDMLNEKTDLCRYAESMSISFGRLIQRIQLNELNKKLMDLSSTDSMTAVKNRTAYEQIEREYNGFIESNPEAVKFALAVFDVNNLKRINDSYGHEKGDAYIIAACTLLCKAYKHSPVYRIGGDEFVVILTGEDEKRRYEIMDSLNDEIKRIACSDAADYEKVSFAGGIAEFRLGEDKSFADVFNRADAIMYEKKLYMKAHPES